MADRRRVLDLLAARATEGLAGPESAELERALDTEAGLDVDQLELAAAAIYLAYDAACGSREPMPEALKRRIEKRSQSVGVADHLASSRGDPPDRSLARRPHPR